MKRFIFNVLTCTLIVCIAFTHTAWAGFIPTDDVLSRKQVEHSRKSLLNLLERDDVRKELQAYGLSPAEAVQRVQALSDSEVKQVTGQLDNLPTGEGAVGIVVGAVVFVFIVLLLTDIFGLTDVFPFVKSKNASK